MPFNLYRYVCIKGQWLEHDTLLATPLADKVRRQGHEGIGALSTTVRFLGGWSPLGMCGLVILWHVNSMGCIVSDLTGLGNVNHILIIMDFPFGLGYVRGDSRPALFIPFCETEGKSLDYFWMTSCCYSIFVKRNTVISLVLHFALGLGWEGALMGSSASNNTGFLGFWDPNRKFVTTT